MKTKAMIARELYCATEALNLLSMYMGLEVYPDGSMYLNDEENDSVHQIILDGYFYIYPFGNFATYELKPNEAFFDVYNNAKLANAMLSMYFVTHNYQIDMFKITNVRPDTAGHLEITFTNGVVYKSAVYKKDSLKYIDLIMRMEQALPMDFDRLRGIDIDDTIK